ncbi:MAG TPA: class I SAM-dependent methyltransferase [Planctomycetota bacterium]|jgi:SAM-dependent methyltransferase
MSDPQTAATGLKEESKDWQEAYRDPQLIARRTRKHRQRLGTLGVFSWPRDSSVLDLACGTGEALRILHGEGFTKLSGVDVTIDQDLKREPWLEVKAGDGRSLPYANETFDAVICMHSLHHLGGLEGIRSTLKEAARILKPGGRLALIDHYDAWQVRFAFWGVSQWWLTWPTSGLRSFHKQHIDEWPYMMDYLNNWPNVRATIDGLGFEKPDVDTKCWVFFYWSARKK